MKLWCIHGNLQTPEVWKLFEGGFTYHNQPLPIEAFDLWENIFVGFEEWTQNFCNLVETDSSNNRHWLLGYSLGGRLALHAYLARPDLWKGAVIIGADTGTSDDQIKLQQLAADKHWGAKYRTAGPVDFFREWDALPVFGGIPNSAPRNLESIAPEKIAACFENYSKGSQADLLPALRKMNSPPLLFVSGEQDLKYTEIGQKLQSDCTVVQHCIVAQSGHRVPWENPEGFQQVLQEFINTMSC
jgi:2-succinyl-6-hydroxy-2,4-cyclohexadiene-1-carboxylate synthase